MAMNGKHLRQLISLLLCLCILLPYGFTSVQADDEGRPMENTYLLRLNTGVNPGTNIRYIAVRYLDTDDISRTELIFPHNGALEATGLLAKSVDSPQERLSLVENAVGYRTIPSSNTDGLQANSLDEYLIQPYFRLKSLIGIDVYQQYSPGMKSWVCTGLKFYQVDTLYGLGMAGYYSDSTFVDFSGKLLWSGSGTMDFTISGTDRIYSLSTETDAGSYTLKNQNAAAYSTHEPVEYLFEIQIADVYGAGTEGFATPVGDNSPTVQQMNVLEFLCLKIEYLDRSGAVRTVNLPVVTSALAWAIENRKISIHDRLIGLGQQGDSLLFGGRLPGFVSLQGCALLYYETAGEEAGVMPSADEVTWDGDTYAIDGYRQCYRHMKNDTLSLTGLKIYRFTGATYSDARAAASAAVRYSGCDYDMRFTVSAKPSLYYASSSVNGETLSFDITPRSFTMLPYSEDSAVSPADGMNGRYIVSLELDEIDAAATSGDVTAVFTYLTTDGTSRKTRPVLLSDAVKEFYGYWPGTNGEYAYQYAAAPGGTLYLALDIADLGQFTGVSFAMSAQENDDIQIRNITIYKPQWIHGRTAVWEKHAAFGNSTDRVFSRDFDTSMIMRTYGNLDKGEAPIYINGNTEETRVSEVIFDPSGASGTVSGGTEPNWNDLRYSMTYKEAKQTFGFTRSRVSYEVEVKVAGNDSATAGNGDCGSDNLFYFQLIFENGTSGYVLANQQLTADGFRAGQSETFTIQTNQDYGEVSAIRVLPDDSGDAQNSDIFDKLNVDYISVTKKTAGCSAKTWIAGDVGWIEIDYRDSSAKNSLRGQMGRTTEQIARDYVITEKGYSTNVLFTLSTGTYSSEMGQNGTYAEDAGSYPQLEGCMTAVIDYYDSNQTIRHKTVDLIDAMYQYNGKQAAYSELAAYTDDNGGKSSCALTDPNWMLRGNSTDRFFVTLHDVQELKSIELQIRGNVSTTWQVNSINAFLVKDEGALRLNAKNEYQRHYPASLEPITEITEENVRLKVTGDGTVQSKVFNFSRNTIQIQETESEWVSFISREPTNENDTLNIFVHPYEDDSGQSMGDYELYADLQYHDKLDRILEMQVRPLEKSVEDGLFYEMNLSVPAMDNLYHMSLTVNSPSTLPVCMDYAIVQHMRSGVVIDTYYLDYHRLDGQGIVLTASPTESTAALQQEEQLVRLFFGGDTVSSVLRAEKNDILVALRYTSTNDVSGKEYNSAFVYLTDLLDENGRSVYDEVAPGMVAELSFHEPFVREITGLTLASAGSVSAVVASAVVDRLLVSGSEPKLIDRKSFAAPEVLSKTPRTVAATQTNVMPVELRLKTAASQPSMDSGTSGSIRMTISYTNQSGNQIRTVYFEDILPYLVDGSFRAEDTAVLQFFLTDVSSIRTITLEPYSDNARVNATWGLDTLTLHLDHGGSMETVERKLGGTMLIEGKPKQINLSNIVVSATASYYNSKVQEHNAIVCDVNSSAKALLYSGDTATIRVSVQGSLPGYGYGVSAALVRDEAETAVTCYTHVASDTIEFHPPENHSGTDDVYRIYITSEESPDSQVVIEIHVESEPTPTPSAAPERTEETPEGSDIPESSQAGAETS